MTVLRLYLLTVAVCGGLLSLVVFASDQSNVLGGYEIALLVLAGFNVVVDRRRRHGNHR